MPIRPMREPDLVEVRKIRDVAFATFLGIPETVFADREGVLTRFRANPESGLVAEIDGAIVGSNFAANWGSFGFFGPLTVKPALWNRGIAQELLAPTMDIFAKWGMRETGLYTFAQSQKHIALYGKFGYWPRFLTAVMSKTPVVRKAAWINYSGAGDQALNACRALTDSIFEGLDVSEEIRAVHEQNLGETVLLWGGDSLDGFAVCHCGEGTEAGSKNCYIKFAAARPRHFGNLLDACEAFALARGLERVEAGMNFEREQACQQMLEHGFRTVTQGVAMVRNRLRAYNRPDVHVIDDWR